MVQETARLMTAWEKYRLAFRTAVVTGLFAVVVGTLLLADYTTRVAKDPLNSPRFAGLKQQLAADPQNAELKQAIRAWTSNCGRRISAGASLPSGAPGWCWAASRCAWSRPSGPRR